MTRYNPPITPANTGARVEMRNLPDVPGAVGYEIRASTEADVLHEISRIFGKVTDLGGGGEFRHPRRVRDDLWIARGYVRLP